MHQAAYFGVHLWARAVRDAGTLTPGEVKEALYDRPFRAPQGTVIVDRHTQHTWKTVRVGRVRADGQFDIVFDAERPVHPRPYPLTRTRGAWATFLAGLSPIAVGADTWGLGAIPPKKGDMTFYEHVILLKKNGIYVLETMNTGRLAKEGVTEFMFVLGQARVRGSVQMIINPVAMW